MKKLKMLSRKTAVILEYGKNKYEIIEFSSRYIYVIKLDYETTCLVEVTSTKIGQKLIKLYKKNKWEKFYK